VAIDLVADGMVQQSVELLPELKQDLDELERLLDDVMTLARLDLAESKEGKALTPLRKEPTLPQDLVARAAERFRAAHPQRQLAVHLDEPLTSLDIDPVLMRRVLDNLIDNARKYSEPSTAIDVDVKRKEGRVALTVRDHGIGIEHKDLEHIFTPFFRTDRSRTRSTGGVGLGLVLARRVVEAHGGTIQIESEVGKGTAVRFELPAP
jgi:two-component system, OmpR family, sensor kinase